MNSTRKCEVAQDTVYMPGCPNGGKKPPHQSLKHPNIKDWAYILHDKDIDNQSNPVSPHEHMVITLNDSIKYSRICDYIGVPVQYVQPIKKHIRKGKHY